MLAPLRSSYYHQYQLFEGTLMALLRSWAKKKVNLSIIDRNAFFMLFYFSNIDIEVIIIFIIVVVIINRLSLIIITSNNDIFMVKKEA